MASVVGLAAVLRFAALDAKSLWLDEIGQVLVAQTGGSTFLRGVAGHVGASPLDYVVTQAVVALAPVNEFTLRVPPAMWGTLAVLALFLYVRAWGGFTLAILSAYLLALAPFHVAYSQEVRFYSLFTLFGILCAWTFYGLRADPTRRNWGLYVLAHVAGVYTHPYTLLLIAVEALGVGAGLALDRWRAGASAGRPDRTFLVGFGAAVGLVLIAFLPWMLFKLSVGGYGALGQLAGAPVDWGELFRRWDDEIVPPGLYLAIFLAVLGSAGLIRRKGAPAFVLLGIIILAPLAVPLLDTLAQYPFARRQILFVLPFLLVTMASGILAVAGLAARVTARPRQLGAGLVALALVAALTWWTLPGLARYYVTPKEDWRGVGALLTENVRPGERVIAPLIAPYLAYYTPQLAVPIETPAAGSRAAPVAHGQRIWFLLTSYLLRTADGKSVQTWLGAQTSLRVNDERRLQLFYVGGGTRAELEVELEARSLPAETWTSLGQDFYARGDWSLAIRAIEKSQALDPRPSEALYWLGVAYARVGNAGAARANLTRFVELKPETADTGQALKLLQSLPNR